MEPLRTVTGPDRHSALLALAASVLAHALALALVSRVVDLDRLPPAVAEEVRSFKVVALPGGWGDVAQEPAPGEPAPAEPAPAEPAPTPPGPAPTPPAPKRPSPAPPSPEPVIAEVSQPASEAPEAIAGVVAEAAPSAEPAPPAPVAPPLAPSPLEARPGPLGSPNAHGRARIAPVGDTGPGGGAADLDEHDRAALALWQIRVQSHLMRHFARLVGSSEPDLVARVHLRIDASTGEILDAALIAPSRDPAWDQAALRAVGAAGWVPAPPPAAAPLLRDGFDVRFVPPDA